MIGEVLDFCLPITFVKFGIESQLGKLAGMNNLKPCILQKISDRTIACNLDKEL